MLNGEPCSPTLAEFLNAELNDLDGGWNSANPMDGAPGTPYDSGNLSSCSIAH
jgi:hypothetical protein